MIRQSNQHWNGGGPIFLKNVDFHRGPTLFLRDCRSLILCTNSTYVPLTVVVAVVVFRPPPLCRHGLHLSTFVYHIDRNKQLLINH